LEVLPRAEAAGAREPEAAQVEPAEGPEEIGDEDAALALALAQARERCLRVARLAVARGGAAELVLVEAAPGVVEGHEPAAGHPGARAEQRGGLTRAEVSRHLEAVEQAREQAPVLAPSELGEAARELHRGAVLLRKGRQRDERAPLRRDHPPQRRERANAER